MGKGRSVAYKMELVRRLLAGERVTALERESGIQRAQIYRWRDVLSREGEAGLDRRPGRRQGYRGPGARAAPVPPAPGPGSPAVSALEELSPELRAWVAGLERTVARQQLELDFFREALQRVEESRRSGNGTGGTASTSRSGR
jgi:transposase